MLRRRRIWKSDGASVDAVDAVAEISQVCTTYEPSDSIEELACVAAEVLKSPPSTWQFWTNEGKQQLQKRLDHEYSRADQYSCQLGRAKLIAGGALLIPAILRPP
jgi:hypothetical protein